MVSLRPNYFNFMGYFKKEGQEKGSSEAPEPPLGPPLLLHMHEVTLKTYKLGLMFNVLPIVCGGICVCLCFGMHYFVYFLVLQSS